MSTRPSGRGGTGSSRARTPVRAPVAPSVGAAADGTTDGTTDAPSPGAGVAQPDRLPDQRARTPLTGRAAILAVVLLVLVLSFAYPFRGWFDQRAQISQLHERTLAQQARIAELTSDLERWDDPAYVETVARERLRFVMPGEASFVVLGGGEPADADALAAPGADDDWYQQLWTTVAVADDPSLSSETPLPDASETPAAPVTPAPSAAPSTGASVLPTP